MGPGEQDRSVDSEARAEEVAQSMRYIRQVSVDFWQCILQRALVAGHLDDDKISATDHVGWKSPQEITFPPPAKAHSLQYVSHDTVLADF